MIKNILSVDLESFIHRQFNLEERIFSDEKYTVKVISGLLKVLKKYNTHVTFFVVGEIYEWYPKLIEQIKAEGHEIAYHTHRHILLKNKETLVAELNSSHEFINKYRPKGFRAPRMFLKKEYLKILSDFGFTYDSSTYGTFSQKKKYFGIEEIPVSFLPYFNLSDEIKFPQNINLKFLTKGIPYGSGLQISIFQKKLQAFINLTNKKNEPAVIFFHPWQLKNYKNETIKKTILNIPRFLYKRKIGDTMEYLLAHNSFGSFAEVLRI